MTTAAFDGQTLAADRWLSNGTAARKIFKLPDGSYLVGAGTFDNIVEVVAWLRSGAKPSKKPSFKNDEENISEILIVKPNGRAYWLTWPFLRRVRVRTKFITIGGGSDFAMGALEAGATAREAVQIAAKHSAGTGRGVDSVCIVKASK